MTKTKIILPTLLILAALVGGLILVNQNQETRRGAAFDTSTLKVLPATKIRANLNDTFSTQLWYYTSSNSKVDGVQTVVCYGTNISLESIVPNQEAGFGNDPITVTNTSNGRTCTTIVVTSSKAASELLTTGRALTMTFKGNSIGLGDINLDQTKSMMTGDNSASATDKNITVTGVEGTTYEIVELSNEQPVLSPTLTPVPQQSGLKLQFKVSFLGMRSDATCAEAKDLPLTVTVRAADGTTKVFDKVVSNKLSEGSNGLSVYQVGLDLGNFNYGSNLAVFIKSPKHLQVKYGVDNQADYYDKSGGELSGLTGDNSTTPVFDFTGYPLLAGDVTGTTAQSQDGVVDGIDFSYVKTESIKRTEVASGGYMLADLNGNCKLESQDLSLLMLSLSERQSQLY